MVRRNYTTVACIVILFAVAPVPLASGLDALGIRLKDTTLRDILLRLGPPDALYFAGVDSEMGTPSATDPIVMRYDESCKSLFHSPCSILLFLRDSSYSVDTVTVLFQRVGIDSAYGPSLDTLVEIYGERYRTVHVRQVLSYDKTESVMGDCDDPLGDVEIRLYKEHALKVFVHETNSQKYAISLVFSAEVQEGENYPPCVPNL